MFGIATAIRLGPFVLRRRLGAGGMGEVFEAHDPRLDRSVALKILARRDCSVPDAREEARLRREARAMARLAHPHVVSVFDAGMDHGRAWIAMEYVRGEDLRAWLRTPRSWQSVLRVFLEAARGLAAIHAAGLVHCDFKPANVMLDEQGRARVTDFGLSRLSGERPGSTRPGHDHDRRTHSSDTERDEAPVGGTPAYMAPEQQDGSTSAAADQYAFCMALQEALWGRARTGVPAATGTPPTRLRRVLSRGLREDPERRWPSMEKLAHELGARPTSRGLVVSAFVAVAGVLLLAMAGAARKPACEDAAEHLAKEWWPEAEGGIERAMRAGDPELGARAWQETDTRVSEWMDAWSDAWRSQCAVEAGPSDASAIVCLEGAREGLKGTVATLRQLEPHEVPRVWAVLDRLPSIGDCTGRARAPEDASPRDPTRRAFWLEARMRLAEVAALHQMGRMGEALGVLDSIDLDPKRDGALELRARITRGSLSAALGDFGAAERSLTSGYFDARRRGDDDLAVMAVLGILDLRVARQMDPATVPHWIGEARSMLKRAGGTPSDRARVKTTISMALLERGDLEGARAWAEDAIAHAPSIAAHSGAEQVAANVASRAGRNRDATEHARNAVTHAVEAFGTDHPNFASAQLVYGGALARAGEGALAREHLLSAQAIRERDLGPDHPEAIAIAVTIGNTFILEDDLEAARTSVQRALNIADRIGSGPLGRFDPLNNLATIAAMAGDDEEAIRRYGQALDACTAALGGDHARCGWVEVLLARALAKTGEIDDARAALSNGAAVLDRDGAPIHLRAEALADLARESWTPEHPEAIATALRALAFLVAGVGEDSISLEQVDELAQWLQTHTTPA